MPSVKILVAEDNMVHASKVEMLLDEMGYELVGTYDNANDFLRLFKATQPDIIILDIQLSQGDDGVSIASKINEIRPTPIIFATSFDDKETINRALKTDPYAYIVKPLERPSLQAAIELAIYKFKRKDTQDEALKTTQVWSEDLVLRDSFFIKTGSKLSKVLLTDILWIEVGQERYCDIVTEKRQYPIRATMNYLEETLDPSMFVRVHRSNIVNIHKVEGIDEVEMVVEISGKSIPLGSAYKANLMNRLTRL